MSRWALSSSAVISDREVPVEQDVVPRVKEFRMGLMSAADVERISAKVITEHAVYARNQPKPDGPHDPALGPSDRRVRCLTCSCGYFGCPGHMGVVHFVVPVYHVGFVDYVYKLVQAVCWNCSALLGDTNDVRLRRLKDARGMVKFTQVTAMGKNRYKCSACGLYQPKYSKKSMVITREFTAKKLEQIDAVSEGLGKSARRLFTPSDALEIFQGMSHDDIRSMGMDPERAHPASMIMQNMAVLPPNARPAIMASEGSKRRGQDDITNQTQDVVKTIRSLRAAIVSNMLAGAVYDPHTETGLTIPPGAGAAPKKRGGGNAAAKMAAAKLAADVALAGVGVGAGEVAASVPKVSAATKKTSATKKRKVAEDAGFSAAGELTFGGADAQDSAVPLDLDVETQRVFLTEFNVGGHALAPLTDAAMIALKFAKADEYFSVSAEQAAAIWRAHPILCEKLQNDVTVLYDNAGRAAPQSQQRSGAAKKSLMNRMTGKTGQIRGGAVAKRCDQNARTVIAPDRFLDVDQLGVPHAFMKILTVPEEVSHHNIALLQEAVRRGPRVANGAARVLHATGQLTQLNLLEEGEAPPLLQVGDVVERHLREGDRIIFNRQPSLHKLSLLGLEVVPVPGLAFRMNLTLTKPFNGDFDGDEMNMHVMQTVYAMAETATLIAVNHNVINPQNNAPCLGIVQDALVGAMLLSSSRTRLGVDIMHQCVGVIKYKHPGKEALPVPAGVDPHTQEPYWTGRQLISMMLPPIFVERRVRGAGPDVGPDDPKERYVLIRNGVLEHGVLCKATLGTGSGTIIHKICMDHGEQAVIRFISDFQRVLYEWLPTHGLTIGLRDCVVDGDVRARIRACTDNADAVVASLTKELAELTADMTEMELAHAENHILTILSSVLNYTSKLVLVANTHTGVAQRPQDPFGLMAMVLSGSKGNTNNVAQIMACLGQQFIEGQRVPVSAQTRRTLTMFRPDACSAAARGFIRRAYVDGMEPHEYFFHMMAGREGLVATAVKTADTGYKYRSMTKGMENNVVQWDFSVRNAQGYIIQFVAGNDAFDPTRVERVNLPFVLRGDAQILAALGPQVPREYAARVLALRNFLRLGILTPYVAEPNTKVLLPLNIPDELIRLQFQLGRRREVRDGQGRPRDPTRDTDEQLCQAVRDLVDVLAGIMPSREVMAPLELAVLYECRPSELRKAGLHTAALFTATLGRTILARTQRAMCQPGDSVGVIAGQSIGEPATQFTLNVFHSAGLVQRLLTVGVPRLKELLHASEPIRTPSMLVPFKNNGAGMSLAVMRAAAAALQFLCIDSVLLTSYPQLDPPGDGVTSPITTMSKDAELLEHATAAYGPEQGPALSPWILRLVLNKAALMEHMYTPEKVARVIATQMTSYKLSIVYSQPNMPHWVVRVRLLGDTTEAGCRKFHAELRETILLGGIDGIKQARVITIDRPVTDPDTGCVTVQQHNVVDTEGTGLMKVATRPWVDWAGVVTNDVQEVVRVLGMAAGRQLLYAELERAISYGGGYIDQRHIRQVVDTMTHRGYNMPYTRHGINRVDFSVLQRASYEEPVDMLLQGAMTAETDQLRGLCECVVFGQKPPIGTGTVEIRRGGAMMSDQQDRPCPASREQDLLRGKCKTFRRRLGADGEGDGDQDRTQKRMRSLPKDVWAVVEAVEAELGEDEVDEAPEGFAFVAGAGGVGTALDTRAETGRPRTRLLSGVSVSTATAAEGGGGLGTAITNLAKPSASTHAVRVVPGFSNQGFRLSSPSKKKTQAA
jgi:DNA-directed RNA polymerase II subunit RPB1